MAQKAKDADQEIKLKQVEIIKFHPLVVHEVGEQPFLAEEKANELIEKKYARAIK
jgi:hypothetical protein